MKNNNFLITGASSDIGQSLTKQLVNNENNRVLAVSKSHLSTLEGANSNYKYLSNIDLTKIDKLVNLSKEIELFFSHTFTTIHCVGSFWYHKPLVNTELDEAKEMVDSHYLTLYALFKVILPILKIRGGGKIIAFSCTSVGYSYPEMTAFTSVKAAIETLVKCVANENSKFGIVANCIALSTIKTQKVETSKDIKYHNGYVSIEELLEVIDDLIAASPLINGNTIKILKYSDSFYNEGYFQRNPSRFNE